MYSVPVDILDLSIPKLKSFAGNNFKFDENVGEFSKRVENTMGRTMLITSNFFFSQSVFKRHVLQTCKKKGLFGRVLRLNNICLWESRKYCWKRRQSWSPALSSFPAMFFTQYQMTKF